MVTEYPTINNIRATSDFPQVSWETDTMLDEVADTIIYAEQAADLAESILRRAEKRGLKTIPKADWNEFKSLCKAFHIVSKNL